MKQQLIESLLRKIAHLGLGREGSDYDIVKELNQIINSRDFTQVFSNGRRVYRAIYKPKDFPPIEVNVRESVPNPYATCYERISPLGSVLYLIDSDEITLMEDEDEGGTP